MDRYFILRNLREIVQCLCTLQLMMLLLISGYYIGTVKEIYENDHSQWVFANVIMKGVLVLIYFLFLLGLWKKSKTLLFRIMVLDIFCFIFRSCLLVKDLSQGNPGDALYNGAGLLFELCVILMLCWYIKALRNETVTYEQAVELTEQNQPLA